MTHPIELHPRRHVFHGHASGVAAHIRRPADAVLEVKSSSTLPVIGGHCESKVGRTKMGKWVSFQSAQTSAHGDYVSAAQGLATTRGKPFEEAATMTKVTARVQGLTILGRVKIADLSLGMEARSAPGTVEPSIRLSGNKIEGVSIDGAKLNIKLADHIFKKYHTKKLLAEAFGRLPDRHKAMFLPCQTENGDVYEFPEANGYVKATIVEKISWDGKPHPDAQIHGNVVRVPGLGKIYFGEMFIATDSRRLTIVRFQLGSDDGGEVTGGDGQTNGTSWPPPPPPSSGG